MLFFLKRGENCVRSSFGALNLEELLDERRTPVLGSSGVHSEVAEEMSVMIVGRGSKDGLCSESSLFGTTTPVLLSLPKNIIGPNYSPQPCTDNSSLDESPFKIAFNLLAKSNSSTQHWASSLAL